MRQLSASPRSKDAHAGSATSSSLLAICASRAWNERSSASRRLRLASFPVVAPSNVFRYLWPRPRNRDSSRKRRYRCRDGGAVWSCEPRHTRCRFQQFRCHLRATDCIVRQAGPGGGEGIAQSNRSADTRGFGVELGDVPAIAVMGRREGQDHSVDQGRPVQAGRFRVAAGPSSWRPHGFGTKQWLIE